MFIYLSLFLNIINTVTRTLSDYDINEIEVVNVKLTIFFPTISSIPKII